jgi:hypothetical protein
LKSFSITMTSLRLHSLLLMLVSVCLPIQAFPPAPYYTLYGMVRDQVGQSITAQGASLILLKDGQEISRTSIDSSRRLDQNYELTISLDHARSGTLAYKPNVLTPQSQFSLVVEMDGALFYPIEVNGSLTAGKGGERVRLDLNLGEDLDGDGLPDIWEQWQLYLAGYYPDENGNWPIHLITRDGDFDSDGFSNWLEYLAGTYATDASETFALNIKEKTSAFTRLEFYGITGKTYTIERSTDMTTWSRVGFSIGDNAALRGDLHAANDVGIVSAYLTPNAGAAGSEFFRLTVR